MRKRAIIYLIVTFVAISLYLSKLNVVKRFTKPLAFVEYTEVRNDLIKLFVQSSVYSRGSFYVEGANNEKYRLDPDLDYEIHRDMISAGDTLLKKEDSDTLQVFNNSKKLYIILDPSRSRN